MFSLVVHMEVRPGLREEFLAGITESARLSVRDEPGCLRFDVCAVEGDENRFFLYEIYVDAAAHAAHKQTSHFLEWRKTADRVLASQQNTAGALVATNAAEAGA
jgi:autoinducer 2-degrading protein